MTSHPEGKGPRILPFKTKICSVGAILFLGLTIYHYKSFDAVWQLTAIITMLLTLWAVVSYATRGAI